MEDSNKLIQDQFNSLPEDVRTALLTTPWRDRVKDIAKRNNLTADQAKALETEVLLILYGFEPEDAFVQNIVSSVEVGEEIAEGIARSIKTEIVEDIEGKLNPSIGSAPAQAELPATPITTSPALSHTTEIVPSPIEIEAPHTALNTDNKTPTVTTVPTQPSVTPKVAPEMFIKAPFIPQPAVTATPAQSVPASSTVDGRPKPSFEYQGGSMIAEKLAKPVSTSTDGKTVASPASYSSGQDPYREPVE